MAKAGAQRFLLSRRLELWLSADYRWREIFEAADVMSEGAVRRDTDGAVYYGTTSLLMPYRSHGGLVPDELALTVGRLVSRDLHARVRAVRIARREAQVRSAHLLGRVHAEVIVRPDSRGIRIDVDIEAPVVEGAAKRKRPASTRPDSPAAPRKKKRVARR